MAFIPTKGRSWRTPFAPYHLPRVGQLLTCPTGAGKTRIAAPAACHLLNEKDTDDSLAIWLASTEELCEQAADELSDAWTYLGQRDASVHRHWGDRSLDLLRLPSGFLVTGLAKLRSAAFQDHTLLAHLANRASAVIFDEAHQAVAETYSFMTEQLSSVRPPLLGLTATPGRTANLTDDDYRLAKMFDHKKVSIDPKGHGNPVTYLIQERYLADPRFVKIDFESDKTIADPIPGTDYSSQDLDYLGGSQTRTRKVVELANDAAKRHPRAIVFCPSVQSALECDRLLRARSVRTGVVTANTPDDERRATIGAFRSADKEHMVMFNYGVLTAGFDAPRNVDPLDGGQSELAGSSAVDSLDPPVALVHLVVAVVDDAGLDQKPVRHGRVVLSYNFIG